MTPTTVHIINHTHWDREWFLTSEYTSQWIPGLIDRLEGLVANNPDYRFLFDGQTLVIEDLLKLAPDYAGRIKSLVAGGYLTIGPYYCQPDWQLTGGELLIRNLLYGQQDARRYGGETDSGWLVDTFGHISQSPQIHTLFGITAAYVWRGVPQLEPYFLWQGADGRRLLTINLFGGYRNLYGVTHAPEVAVKRLYAEVAKLRSYYPTADIPLFDGYDLEDDPEDPLQFYSELHGIGADLVLCEATPAKFAQEIEQKQLALPTLCSELNSGKYGATFPGTLSTRTYLKVMAHDCEYLLFQVCEPLATLAALKGRPYNSTQYEAWGRLLLQNAVHDCICGVSIDQVHEKMAYSYRQMFDAMQADAQASLAFVLGDFAPGEYAVSTNPFTADTWQIADQHLIHARTNGIGVWTIDERVLIEYVEKVVESFTWRNDHYEATIGADGVIRMGSTRLGILVVSAEHGDTYSDEAGEALGVMQPTTPLSVEQQSLHHCVIRFNSVWKDERGEATAIIRLLFDPSPLIQWQIDLDTRGVDLRVEMIFETVLSGHIRANMPFDVVERPAADTDLLPHHLPTELDKLLLGQRELNSVSTFPFHDFVAVADEERTAVIFAKGLHAYAADEQGTVTLPLQRAVEWLTRADLRNRVGDAGPFFYVPDARGERSVRHQVAMAMGEFQADSMTLQRLNTAYQNPPIIVRTHGNGGTQTNWEWLQEDIPLSGLFIQDGAILARFYNPTGVSQSFSQTHSQTDVWGHVIGNVDTIRPKQIMTIRLAYTPSQTNENGNKLELLTPVQWRVGENGGLPDPAILAQLEEKIAKLEAQLAKIEVALPTIQGAEQLRLRHRYFILKRESVEFQLSLLLNRLKFAEQGVQRYEYLYQPNEAVAAVGLALNRLRIKRRIFDYVVQAL